MKLGGVDLGNLILVHLWVLVKVKLVKSLENKWSSKVIHFANNVSEELIEIDIWVSVGIERREKDSKLVVGNLEAVVVEDLEKLGEG